MKCYNCEREFFSHDECPYCEEIRCIDCDHACNFNTLYCDCKAIGRAKLVKNQLWHCSDFKEKV